MSSKRLPYEVYKSGQKCANNAFGWHKVDGYCKQCASGFVETNDEIQARRNAKGYR